MNLSRAVDSDYDYKEQHVVVEQSKRDSYLAFKKVEPFIESFGGRKVVTDMKIGPDGDLYETQLGRTIDREAGIDGFIKLPSVPDGTDLPGVIARFETRDGSVKAYAMRMRELRKDQRDFDSFTTRVEQASGFKTEYQKLIERVDSNQLLRPDITIQGYMREGKLTSLGVVATDVLAQYMSDVIGDRYKEHISDNPGKYGTIYGEYDQHGREKWALNRYKDQKSGNITHFISVPWQALRASGATVDVYRFDNGDFF